MIRTLLYLTPRDGIHTGNGGGYGDPARRPRELVADDVANGLLTPERAREAYRLAH